VGGAIACDEANFPVLLRRYRLGLALFVLAVAMLFVGFGSAYVVRRGIPTYDATAGAYSASWEPLQLPLGLLLLNTCFLILASGAIEVVRRRTPAWENGKDEIGCGVAYWLTASLVLGAGFLVGQAIAWRSLTANGQRLTTGARTAFFYVLTGAHAVHALVGILVLAVLAVFYGRFSPMRRYLALDLSAWYLHAMTLLWICLLGFLLYV